MFNEFWRKVKDLTVGNTYEFDNDLKFNQYIQRFWCTFRLINPEN